MCGALTFSASSTLDSSTFDLMDFAEAVERTDATDVISKLLSAIKDSFRLLAIEFFQLGDMVMIR